MGKDTRERKPLKIQQSNICKNSNKRILHKYKKGYLITLRKLGVILPVLAILQQGPYKVLKHYVNGSITTEFEPNVIEWVNMRRCHPYYILLDTTNDHDMNIQPTNTKVVWVWLLLCDKNEDNFDSWTFTTKMILIH